MADDITVSVDEDGSAVTVTINEVTGGTGDASGPASSTDNAVARFDGTGGKTLQNSSVTIDDSGNIVTSGTVDGRDVSTDGTKLDTIETNADVTDETNVTSALDGATLTATTVAVADKILIQDADDSDNLKTVTVQGIVDLTDASPLTTKGDLYTYSTDDARLAIGTNNQVLTADSSEATGMKWATVSGTGDVVGPASAVDNNIVTFDTTTGKLIQDSGTAVSDLATAAQGALADSATQPGDNISTLTNDSGFITATLTQEQVEDYAGNMIATGGTKTGITVTYQDGTNDMDFVVSDTTVAGDSGSTGITPGDTLTVAGGTNATTSMSGDILTVNVDDAFILNTGDVGTGVYDFGGADSFEIPNSATPTVNADGEIAVDTTVTDFSHGVLKYYGGEELGVVAMPISQFTTPTEGHVVAYNATNDEFELVAAAGGDVTKVGTPVDNQIGVWTGDGTIEGDTSLTWDGTNFNIATAKNFQIAGATILADAAGTTTLSNIDAVDATTTTTISQVIPVAHIAAVSDETTALTTGTAKLTFRMPYAMTLTAVRASVTTAPTGSALTVDINESGTTILSTKLTIDAGEKTSTTAATPPVISDSALADDAEITIDIDAVGSTVAGAGLKVTLIGTQA